MKAQTADSKNVFFAATGIADNVIISGSTDRIIVRINQSQV